MRNRLKKNYFVGFKVNFSQEFIKSKIQVTQGQA